MVYNAKKRGAFRNPLIGENVFQMLLVVLLFLLLNDFCSVVEATVLANSVRFRQLVTMRALDKRGSRRFVVRKSLIRSALGLFALRYCHINTSC